MSENRVRRVGILGSYGGLNLGDEAILHAMVEPLRDLPVEITVLSRNPEDTLERHDVARAVPVRELTRDEARDEIRRLDLLILGGGGILYDRGVHNYLRIVTLAHELDVATMVYAVSAGPLEDRATQKAVRAALERAAIVTVRDRHARALLEEIGVRREIIVTADPALLLDAEPLPDGALEREGLDVANKLVGVSVREPGPAAPDIDVEHYHELLANAADFMIDRLDARVVFVPMERNREDLQHSHAVLARMQHAACATIVEGEYSAGQLRSLIGNFEFAIGMRLHFLIFAALEGVPFIPLPYASKVKGFVEDLGIHGVEPLQRVSAGPLLAHLDRSWDLRAGLRARIRDRLPALQARARETHLHALRLLGLNDHEARTE